MEIVPGLVVPDAIGCEGGEFQIATEYARLCDLRAAEAIGSDLRRCYQQELAHDFLLALLLHFDATEHDTVGDVLRRDPARKQAAITEAAARRAGRR